ncbi:MAG: molybdenum cofactor guanylyltransferase [Anaerolineales bacterium]|jgi:molybdenum cofactor guanylyltransferase
MITVAIQAGGHSNRMGRDKALIPLAGKPLIQHVIERIDGLGDEILVTTNRPQDYAFLGLRLASDRKPGEGTLIGLQTALEHAQGQTVLLLACDMPFVSRRLLEHLLQLAPQADVVIPRRGDFLEPLQAVYSRSCLPAVEAALARGEQRMVSFFPQVTVLPVEQEDLDRFDPKGLSFFNINRPQDLAQAESMVFEA